MKIKKGDKVLIIKGKDRSKIGVVNGVYEEGGRVLVEGVNLVKKHVKPRQQNQKGQRVEIEMPIDKSNVKLMCPKCNKSVRTGYKFIKKTVDPDKRSKKGKSVKQLKVRYCKKCQQEI